MNSKGYTLIELLIVIAIIGIIAAVGYPSYKGYVKTTYQAQATADLKACALALDRYYSNGFTYVGADTNNVCTLVSPTNGTAKYDISYQTLSKSTYSILATPVGGSCGGGSCIQLSADGTQTNP